MTDSEQEKAKQWWAENAATFHQPGKMGFFMTDVLAAYASSQLSSKEEELAELRREIGDAFDAIFPDVPESCTEHGEMYSLAGKIGVLREQVERLTSERDAALANADFWERELNNFRRNAAHRAEQLAKEKVDAAESRVASMETALSKAIETIRAWHGMSMPRAMEKKAWELYQNSPEMKAITAALSSTTQEK